MEDPQCVRILLKCQIIVRLTLSIDFINLSCFLQGPRGQGFSPALLKV